MMLQIIGIPDKDLIQRSSRWKYFFHSNGKPFEFKDKEGKSIIPGSKSLEKILSGCGNKYLNLVKHCLEWDPSKRLSPYEALEHQFYKEKIEKQLPQITPFSTLSHNFNLDQNYKIDSFNSICINGGIDKRKFSNLNKFTARITKKLEKNNNQTIEESNFISPRLFSRLRRKTRVKI